MFIFLFGPMLVLFGLIFGGIAFGMAVTGGPDPCEAGGTSPIVFSQANATSFQQKWDAFDATLDGGSPASVTFNESEVSSRAWWEVVGGSEDGDDVFEGPRVCLHDGYGEVSARLDFPGFLDIKMKVRGTATITDELVISIDDAEIGNVPGFLLDRINVEDIRGDLTDAISSSNGNIPSSDELEHTYRLSLREGEAQVDGTP